MGGYIGNAGPVYIGDVRPVWYAKCDREQSEKILSEAAEVFEAVDAYAKNECYYQGTHLEEFLSSLKCAVLDECADLITAVCGVISALGVDDFSDYMRACEQRNRERGRM